MGKKQNNISGNKTGYYGYSSENRSVAKKNSKKSNSGDKKALGLILVLVQLILSIVFVGLVVYKRLAFITAPVLAGLIAVLIVFLALVLFLLQKSKGAQTGGKVISIIVILILALLIYLVAPLPRMSGKKVSDKPFTVFVSAADTFGDFDENTLTRSDTNILAVVNPKTYTVLMVSTPRDYYIPVQAKSVAPESYEKLTHIGLYGNGIAYKDNKDLTASDWQWAYQVQWHPGLNALMDSLQNLYQFDTKNYEYHHLKVNFTGFADLIDALGGITVNVDQAFSTRTYATYSEVSKERKTYTYTEGDMKMDGATALTYARERHSFGNGDMQRNKNQVKVLKAMEAKIISGSTLLNYNNVLKAIRNSFTTDLDISSLVNLQMALVSKSDYKGWNVMSYSVVGQPSRKSITWDGSIKAVVLQDEESINNASNLINMTLKGEDAATIKKQIKEYNQ